MAGIRDPLKSFRRICESLPGAVETAHFGSVCFCLGKAIFATCGEKDDVWWIVVQLEPDHAVAVLANDDRFTPYSRKTDCVMIRSTDVRGVTELRELIVESYGVIAKTASKVKPTATEKTPGTVRRQVKKKASKAKGKNSPADE